MGLEAGERTTGFASIDSVVSMIPLVMMLSFMMVLSYRISEGSAKAMHDQEVFDKIVSIADYSVKAGLSSRSDEGSRGDSIHNLINASALTDGYALDLRKRYGLSRLSISISSPAPDMDFCIYRIIAVGKGRSISRLFVCGS